MDFDTGGIQAHDVSLDLNDLKLLQTPKGFLWDAFFRPAAHPSVNCVPVFAYFLNRLILAGFHCFGKQSLVIPYCSFCNFMTLMFIIVSLIM